HTILQGDWSSDVCSSDLWPAHTFAAIKIHKRVRRPKLSPQLFAGHHFPGMFQKERENLERLFLQFDAHAVLAQLGGLEIDFKNTKTPGSKGTFRRSHDHSPLQFRERSTPSCPNQYGPRPTDAQARPNLEALQALAFNPC